MNVKAVLKCEPYVSYSMVFGDSLIKNDIVYNLIKI